MKFKLKDIDKKWKEYALAGCVCILFFVILTHLEPVWSVISVLCEALASIFIGFVVAYIVNPLVLVFDKKVFRFVKTDKRRWNLSVVVAVIIILVLLAVLMVALVPQMTENIITFVNNYPEYVEQLESFLEKNGGQFALIKNLLDSISAEGSLVNKIGNFFKENATVIIDKVGNFGTKAVNWLVGAIFAIYFLLAKAGICGEAKKLFSLMLSPLKYERLTMVLKKFNAIFSKYITCELIDSLIIGVANYLFMVIMKMPDALFISFIVGVTNLVPTFGPVIGGAIGAFMLLLLSPSSVLPFLLCCVVLQTLDVYVIKPKLFGNALSVPGVVILISIIVFGKLMGIVGMLIAIPVAGIIVYAYTEGLIPWLELRKDLKAYNKEQGK